MKPPEDEILKTYNRLWGKHRDEVRPRLPDDTLRDFPDIKILIFPPSRLRENWVYATVGLHSMQSEGISAAEVHLHVYHEDPPSRESAFQALSNFMDYAADHQLDYGQVFPCLDLAGLHGTVSPPSCNHLVTAFPFMDAEGLPEMEETGSEILFFWLLPVTDAEARFLSESGYEALESLLIEKEVQYFGWDRPSVV